MTNRLVRHRFHALCPYFAMFPESFVAKWVEQLTKPGDIVADPFCGRGTAPFQALLMDRGALANDINPVAYCVTKAKTQAPALGWPVRRLEQLERKYRSSDWEPQREALPAFFHLAYSHETLRRILYLRSELNWRASTTDCMLAAIILGALHGDLGGLYLSNQMPRTISTKPAYSMKFWRSHGLLPPPRDVFAILKTTLNYRYESHPPPNRGIVLNRDIRDIPGATHLPAPIRFAITSPPYLDTTNFEEDQWLRLWFLGGPAQPTYRRISTDDRHTNPKNYWSLISDMWRVLSEILSDNAHIIIRLSARGETGMETAERLEGASLTATRSAKLVTWETSEVQRRQTNSFRPGSLGVVTEVDCHFTMA